jgi:molybdopterin converting factor small subunit
MFGLIAFQAGNAYKNCIAAKNPLKYKSIMTIIIKLFGPLRRAAGRGELAIAVEHERPTCGEIRARLGADEPLLAGMLPACRFAVNHAFVAEGCEITACDEVALIGLTSGGDDASRRCART